MIYTIPPALILTFILWPLFTRLDIYKIIFLITVGCRYPLTESQLTEPQVAVTYTIPWDSYLIRAKVWTYPQNVVLGPTIFDIPIEEIFFFVVQTYTTTLLYILLNKPTLFPIYITNDCDLSRQDAKNIRYAKRLGQINLAFCIGLPLFATSESWKESTYIRLILLWAGPVLLALWTLAYQLLLLLPFHKTWLVIAIPTLYLWVVDTLALRRGTWSIETGTKLGWHLWPGLEIEEAVFFLLTNALIVFGCCAFDNAIAILDVFPHLYPKVPTIPSPHLMLRALFTTTSAYDEDRLVGLEGALDILSRKSRSFYLASGVFSGRLRIDLVLLYSFCRVADDLVDHAEDQKTAEQWITRLKEYLDAAYKYGPVSSQGINASEPFPEDAKEVLKLLPVDRLPSAPLYSLLDGFRTDLLFAAKPKAKGKATTSEVVPTSSPIVTEDDLEQYAYRVASTVAELCLSLVYFHDPSSVHTRKDVKEDCLAAGARMGRALQYINIARDVVTDARDGRCYIPLEWLTAAESSPQEFQSQLLRQRVRVLGVAFQLYKDNRQAIENLPVYARDGIRVAVESYVEIGRVMQERLARGEALDMSGGGRSGRASVPKLRRLWLAWRVMAGPVHANVLLSQHEGSPSKDSK